MPERKYKAVRKVESDEVQGPGSWVVLRAPTLADVINVPDGDDVASHLVVDWNWVDDDGNPLPKPTPEYVKGIPFQELNFILQALRLDGITDTKN
jgi:hypothetical protein